MLQHNILIKPLNNLLIVIFHNHQNLVFNHLILCIGIKWLFICKTYCPGVLQSFMYLNINICVTRLIHMYLLCDEFTLFIR